MSANIALSSPSSVAVPAKQKAKKARTWPYYTVLIAWAGLTLFILIWLVLSSLKTNVEVFGSPWALPATPLDAAAANFGKAWNTSRIGAFLGNSVIVTTASVLLTVAVSAPAAFVLSRVPFFGRTFLSYYFVAGMGLPLQLIMIPLFVLLSNFKMANTLQGLIAAYVATSIPFTILLLTGFFRTLPSELEDAAAIDGCSEAKIFFRVMLPLGAPGIMTAVILNFVTIWNEFLLALLILKSDAIKTMPIGIYGLRMTMQYTADWSALFAGIVIVLVPNLIFYVLFSDRIAQGLTLGADK